MANQWTIHPKARLQIYNNNTVSSFKPVLVLLQIQGSLWTDALPTTTYLLGNSLSYVAHRIYVVRRGYP